MCGDLPIRPNTFLRKTNTGLKEMKRDQITTSLPVQAPEVKTCLNVSGNRCAIEIDLFRVFNFLVYCKRPDEILTGSSSTPLPFTIDIVGRNSCKNVIQNRFCIDSFVVLHSSSQRRNPWRRCKHACKPLLPYQRRSSWQCSRFPVRRILFDLCSVSKKVLLRSIVTMIKM